MVLITSMPSAEQTPGIQSTKLMCTSEPLSADLENVAASMKKKKPRENWGPGALERQCEEDEIGGGDVPGRLLDRRLRSARWRCSSIADGRSGRDGGTPLEYGEAELLSYYKGVE